MTAPLWNGTERGRELFRGLGSAPAPESPFTEWTLDVRK